MDADLLYTVLRALQASGVSFKIVGGVALNLVGLPRATQDRADADRLRRHFEIEDD